MFRMQRSYLMVLLAVSISAAAYGYQLDDTVERFVHQQYIHGVPYRAAKQLGPTALPHLERMLQDQSEEEHWAKIVTIIGFIGNIRSAEPLIIFLEDRFKGEVTIHQFRALLMVNEALGHVARNGSQVAFEHLMSGCNIDMWIKKGIKWRYANYYGERLAILLAKVSVNGLSHSGMDEAKEILLGLKAKPESDKAAIALHWNIEEGLERIDRIRNEGATAVFEP